MPLEQDASKRGISRNIATEIRSGKKPKQAAAIAYSVARENGAKIPKKSTKSLRNKYGKKGQK